MEDEEVVPVKDSIQQFEPSVEHPGFEQRARTLYEKYDLTSGIPHIDRVIQTAREFAEIHQVPEAFWDDELNLALVLGCAQKLIESTDPFYRRRVENFAKRLVVPSVPKGILDEDELWGFDPDRAGLRDEKLIEYVRSRNDQDATAEFVQKHRMLIEECKTAWSKKRYDLDIQVYIVDDTRANFQKITGSAGWILPPDGEKLDQPSFKPAVELVLLKGFSAEREEYINHELYHIKDYFGYARRGYQNGIFEALDELHTEYVVGNYTEQHGENPFEPDQAYFVAKQFWDRLYYLGGLDFHLLGDRQVLFTTLMRNFGFAGLVDFALVYAHEGGKARVFETFYNYPDRAVMTMIVERAKLRLRKYPALVEHLGVEQLCEAVRTLSDYMTPSGKEWMPQHRSLYDLLPTFGGRHFAARTVGKEGSLIDNLKAKEIIVQYGKAIAIAELDAQEEIQIALEAHKEILEALKSVPCQRHIADYKLDEGIQKEKEERASWYENEEELEKSIIRRALHKLLNEVPHVELAFHLQNQELKQSMFDQLFAQVDILAEYIVTSGNPKYLEWFVGGIYGYNYPFEIREAVINHLSNKFPQLRLLLDQYSSDFDSRKTIVGN